MIGDVKAIILIVFRAIVTDTLRIPRVCYICYDFHHISESVIQDSSANRERWR